MAFLHSSWFPALLFCLTVSVLADAGIPPAADVAGYERIRPVFQSKKVPAETGDRLLAALRTDGALAMWPKNGLPPGIICALPMPRRIWLGIKRHDGTVTEIGFASGGGLVELSSSLYEVSEQVRPTLASALDQLEDDLRKEVTSEPLPCRYAVDTAADGGTLSGIARLFYGKPGKWKDIYEANRDTIKDPNSIRSGQVLVIPRDNSPHPTTTRQRM